MLVYQRVIPNAIHPMVTIFMNHILLVKCPIIPHHIIILLINSHYIYFPSEPTVGYIYICFYFYPHSIPMKPLLNPIKPPFIIIYRYLIFHFVWKVSNRVRAMQIIVYRFHLNHLVSTTLNPIKSPFINISANVSFGFPWFPQKIHEIFLPPTRWPCNRDREQLELSSIYFWPMFQV